LVISIGFPGLCFGHFEGEQQQAGGIADQMNSSCEAPNSYYISENGKDTNSGKSSSVAWRTINRANMVSFGPCDRLLFEGGNRFPGTLIIEPPRCNTTAENPLLITSYGEGAAIIFGGDDTAIKIHNCGGVTVQNLVIQGSGIKKNHGHGLHFINDQDDDKKLESVSVTGVDISGFRKGGISIEATKARSGFRHVKVLNSTIHHNGSHGIESRGNFSSTLPGYAHEDVYVAHNHVHNNEGDPDVTDIHTGNGIVLGGVDGGIIEHNISYENGAASSPDSGGGPVGIWIWDSNSVVIQFNESHHNHTRSVDGGGFDLDGGVTNSFMQYNYSHDNDGPGILVYEFHYARPIKSNVIRYNLSVNDGRKQGAAVVLNSGYQCPWGKNNPPEDCHWSTISDVLLHNNTIIVDRNKVGDVIPFRSHGSAHDNFSLYNNIFYVIDYEACHESVPCRDRMLDLEWAEGLSLLGNLYFSNDGIFTIKNDNTIHDNLEIWRIATGQETKSDGSPAGMAVNPMLLMDSKSDLESNLYGLYKYSLSPDSPAIDAAVEPTDYDNIAPGTHDICKTRIPIGHSRDLGALEFTNALAPRVHAQASINVQEQSNRLAFDLCLHPPINRGN
jgi:hypothetical protein